MAILKEASRSAMDAIGSSRSSLTDEARSLIVALACSQRTLIESANELMLARDLADLLERGADSAVNRAVGCRTDDEAVDRAVSSVRAASEARENEMRALERWVSQLDRVDDLVGAATRLTSSSA